MFVKGRLRLINGLKHAAEVDGNSLEQNLCSQSRRLFHRLYSTVKKDITLACKRRWLFAIKQYECVKSLYFTASDVREMCWILSPMACCSYLSNMTDELRRRRRFVYNFYFRMQLRKRRPTSRNAAGLFSHFYLHVQIGKPQRFPPTTLFMQSSSITIHLRWLKYYLCLNRNAGNCLNKDWKLYNYLLI